MATIQTMIELYDAFSSPMMDVISSVNLGLSAIHDLHQTMSAPVDMTSLDGARDSITQAAAAFQRLGEVAKRMDIPAPQVPQPIQWESEGLQVFQTAGAARFQQEIQSANSMLHALNATQLQIAEAAAQMDLFPANAAADLNDLHDRLQAIQQRMQLIENNPINLGAATANAELEQLRGQMHQAVLIQENLNRAVSDMDAQAANAAYLRLSQTIGQTERYIRDNVDAQGRFNREIDAGVVSSGNLLHSIQGMVAAYATVQTAARVLDLSDTLTNTTARLNLMNDGLQSVADLQNMIFLSAERSHGAYQATADAVSKLGLMAGDAFGSSAEIVAFMEQINKQFTIAGTETAGIEAAMLQLTQAMGSGVLRGEEFNSVLEQAPNIIQAIADYMELPRGQLKELAADGLITAEIVKNAMFAAAEETNAKFESMPMTWAQVWTSFENHALLAFEPVLQRMNEIANHEEFQQFVNRAIDGLALLAGVALQTFDLLTSATGAVADHWSMLAPIIWGVVAALVVYNATQGIAWFTTMKTVAAQTVHTIASAAETVAIFAMMVAQEGLNAALMACPLSWIVIGIIALIAIFYAVVAAVNHFAGTSVSATGIICGAFAVAGAVIGNILIGLNNFVVTVFVTIWNIIADVANFLGNAFIDPAAAVGRIFAQMVDTCIAILQPLASAIDAIFGTDFTVRITEKRNSVMELANAAYGEGREIIPRLNAADYYQNRIAYTDAWNTGYSFGEGLQDRISQYFSVDMPDFSTYADLSNYAAESTNAINEIADSTGAIRDSVSITAEELRYMRDIAEREAINRFTTAEIHIQQNNENHISSDMDVDGIMNEWARRFTEDIDISREGAPA